MRVVERAGRAMGTDIRLVAVGAPPGALDDALERLTGLEARWSRFRPGSELNRLNASAGRPCVVSGDTFLLVERLVEAWRITGGRFDPTVLDTLRSLGYDRPWPVGSSRPMPSTETSPVPGAGGITLDRASRLVWLPDGVRLDPGGLGKGLAADLLATQLRAHGASGVLVDLVGDIRAVGHSAEGTPWRLGVEHPSDPDRVVAVVETTDGGIATTSRRRRRWTHQGRAVHHVIDPATGAPADVPWTSATALAQDAADAEVAATVAFLDGSLDRARFACAGLLVDADGEARTIGPEPALFALSPRRPAPMV